eukprot:COSAG05_NODE_10031_length_587_cov_0.745902_1_plen_132_part_01
MRRLRSVWAVMCVAGVASPWPIAGAEFAPGGTGSSATAPPRAGAVDVGAPGAARRRLFSDPAQAMPDVYMSESVVELDEGKSATYTVQLTHAPGMREDGTVSGLLLPQPTGALGCLPVRCVLMRVCGCLSCV